MLFKHFGRLYITGGPLFLLEDGNWVRLFRNHRVLVGNICNWDVK